ncbi:hypothetical protein K458DRAFT_434663 [Lentithecium fluviatile CBS 122367]|uniref:Uncharacterized protein n=1 Tax=Lentithecium fluviatile CBS 122367 TaxID=1168545 RepID=A0A6G1IPW3_9PLEO|nr:hypothetical protein K458DRAFT_434663 [Lentithecium fluviatile CBS 122367]
MSSSRFPVSQVPQADPRASGEDPVRIEPSLPAASVGPQQGDLVDLGSSLRMAWEDESESLERRAQSFVDWRAKCREGRENHSFGQNVLQALKKSKSVENAGLPGDTGKKSQKNPKAGKTANDSANDSQNLVSFCSHCARRHWRVKSKANYCKYLTCPTYGKGHDVRETCDAVRKRFEQSGVIFGSQSTVAGPATTPATSATSIAPASSQAAGDVAALIRKLAASDPELQSKLVMELAKRKHAVPQALPSPLAPPGPLAPPA